MERILLFTPGVFDGHFRVPVCKRHFQCHPISSRHSPSHTKDGCYKNLPLLSEEGFSLLRRKPSRKGFSWPWERAWLACSGKSQRAGELVHPGASLGQWRVRFWSVNILASAWLSWDDCGSRLQESPFGAYWVWDANYTSQWSQLVITDYSSGWSLGWRYKFISSKRYFNFGFRSKIGREEVWGHSPGIFKTSKEKGRLEKKSEKSHPMK